MTQNTPRPKIDRKTVKGLLKRPGRPEHGNYTFRLEKKLFEEFREKAKKQNYSATQVLEALMKEFLR